MMGHFGKAKDSRWSVALLMLSLLLNLALGFGWMGQDAERLQISEPIAAFDGSVEERQSTPMCYSDWFDDTDATIVQALSEGELTSEESRDLMVFLINERYQEDKERILRISDSWLTLDEISEEGLKRFEELQAREEVRRKLLEEVMSKPWAEVDLEFGWSRRGHFYMFCAVNTSLAKSMIPKLNSIVVDGLRNAGIVKASPFGIITADHIAAMNDLVGKREARMRTLLSEADFQSYFMPLIANNVYDVWGPKERFGRELTDAESDGLLKLLMPEHPLNHTFGYREDLDRKSLPKSVMPQVRDLVGDGTFSNLLKNQSPDLNWEGDLHLHIYDLEQQFRDECSAQGTNPLSPPSELLERYLRTVSDVLGDEFSAFIATDQGAWLNPEFAAE